MMNNAERSDNNSNNKNKNLSMKDRDSINSTPWDDSLECIDSLLDSDCPALAFMTDRQKMGLKTLRAMLLLGVNRATNHVPRALLDADENSSTEFLLSEYAGYTRPSETKGIEVILSAHKCARKIAKYARESLRLKTTDVGNTVTNIPAYWTNLDVEAKLKLRDLLSWENLRKWNFNIFDVDRLLKGKHTLIFVSWAIIAAPQAQYSMDLACSQIPGQENTKVVDFSERKGYNLLPNLGVKESTLVEFLYAIERRYNSGVTYHNAVHAADVTQSLHTLLQMGGEKFASEKWELFSVLIAAVVHDVGHCGMNNTFHINSRSDLALLYNDVSILENMHAATAFRMIMGDKRDERLDIFESFRDEDVAKARKFIIKVILSTDMTKHFSKKNFIKGILMNTEDEDGNITPCCTVPKDNCLRHEVLSFLGHLADVSNPTKDIKMATIWTDKLLEEWYRQGDLELQLGLPYSQGCDRHAQTREQSQIGFINFIVLPSFKLLGELIPRVEKEILPQIEKNLQYWKEQERLNKTTTI